MGKEKVVLVYSGGLDSTTVLYELLHRNYEVIALSINYWQKHSKELEQATTICKDLGVEQIILDLSQVSVFQNNGLVNKDVELKDGMYDKENIVVSMVPNRNAIFANYALSIAMERGAIGIALGIHAEDPESGEIEYPDCSHKFVVALQNLAKEIDFKPYEVIVPFTNQSKVDVVKRGLELGVPYEKTISCYRYNEGEIACGVCGTCIQRKMAFEKNNAVDPIPYKQ